MYAENKFAISFAGIIAQHVPGHSFTGYTHYLNWGCYTTCLLNLQIYYHVHTTYIKLMPWNTVHRLKTPASLGNHAMTGKSNILLFYTWRLDSVNCVIFQKTHKGIRILKTYSIRFIKRQVEKNSCGTNWHTRSCDVLECTPTTIKWNKNIMQAYVQDGLCVEVI